MWIFLYNRKTGGECRVPFDFVNGFGFGGLVNKQDLDIGYWVFKWRRVMGKSARFRYVHRNMFDEYGQRIKGGIG
jgi:hypothetical protein